MRPHSARSHPPTWFLVTLLTLGGVPATAHADDWPQWLGPQRDGVWRETGLMDRFPPGGPPVRWRTPVGMGYAGPAVAGGRVYVADWVLDAGARSPKSGFSKRGQLSGKERILCLDEATGKVLWQHEYPTVYRVDYPGGPRCTPAVAAGKVYTLGTMGDLLCLDAASGTVIWSKNFPKDYEADVPVWGFAAHPLVDGDKVICLVGGAGSVAVAFHKDTGKELWRALSAPEPGYCPPILITAGGARQLIVWHPEAVNGLDPETGKVYWSVPFRVKAGLTISTPRQQGNRLFVTSFYNGALMLQLDPDKPGAHLLWKGKGRGERPDLTDTLHSIMGTPYFKDSYIYGVCSHGELRCLRADTGERVWESLQATGSSKRARFDGDRWNNAFLVPQDDRFFLFTEKGDLVIARLSPKGYDEVSRTHILEPTNTMPGRPVVWMHPAFAHRCVYARNDKEILCVSLAAP